jgi:hypothetical protein
MTVGIVWAAAAPAVCAEEVPFQTVPAAVTDALKARFPYARVLKVDRDTDGGRISYEFDLMAGNTKAEVEFSPQGQFIRSKERLAAADVPANVKDALRRTHPAAGIKDVVKVTTGDGEKSTVRYKSEVKVGSVDRDIVVDVSGRLISDRVD